MRYTAASSRPAFLDDSRLWQRIFFFSYMAFSVLFNQVMLLHTFCILNVVMHKTLIATKLEEPERQEAQDATLTWFIKPYSLGIGELPKHR